MLSLLGYSLLLLIFVAVIFLLAVVEAAAIEVRQRNAANLVEFQPKRDGEPPAADTERDIRRAA
jgi:hypothetical protein